MPHAPLGIALALALTIALGRLGVSLPVPLLVAGMGVAPLLPAVADDLSIEGIGADLVAVVIGAAVPLAFRLAANELPGTER